MMDWIPPAPEGPDQKPQPGLYATSSEALKKVCSEYEYWSGKFTETSVQMCYALIGANWVVFGSVNGILNSKWAKLSLFTVILTLSANVIGSWFMSKSLRRRISYAEKDGGRWECEYKDACGKSVAWPFADRHERVGFWLRQIKGALPLLAGVLLITGAVLK